MNRRTLLIPILAVALCVGGCQSTPVTGTATTQPAAAQTPAQRLALAEQSFRVSLDIIHAAVAAGLISPSDLKAWVPVEQAVGNALDVAEVYASDKTKGATAVEAAISAAESAIPRLAPLVAYIQRVKPVVPTAPAPK